MSNSAQLRFTTLHAELVTQVVELSNNSVQAVCEPEVSLTRTDTDTQVQLPPYIEIGNVATMVEYLNSSSEVLELIMEQVNSDYVATDNWRSLKL
ncbi:hypothetical protein H7171_03545 [Candidatus Saccharibacteria bacterium]|nr:hypothetical protein [Candidatus Saccharibacteria bacterium]